MKNKLLYGILSFYFSFSITFTVEKTFSLILFLLIFIPSFVIFKFVFEKLSNFSFNNKEAKMNNKEFLLYGTIIFIALLFALWIFYPALMSPDSLSQLEQAKTNEYSNWHPIIHTLLFFKLPYSIYGHPVSCAIFQLLYVGCILFYLCIFLRRNFLNFKHTLLILLIIILNPLFYEMSMYLWKDIAFSWALLLVTLYTINIVISNGKWIYKTLNKVAFIFASLGVLLFRHNGILSISILIIALMIVYKEKFKFYLLLLIFFCLLRFILYGPIYNYFNFGKDGGRVEMIGVPSYQISYFYHKNYINLDDDIKVLSELAPKEKWEEKYNPISFNYLKWDTNYGEWANNNFNKIMNIWIKYSLSHPKDFIISYLNITSPIWKINSYAEYRDIEFDSSATIIQKIYEWYCGFISFSIFQYILLNYGTALFVIIFSLTLVIYKFKKSFDKYLPFILVLSNTVIIMILITGGETRFVYSQLICAIPLLVYVLSIPKEKIKKAE